MIIIRFEHFDKLGDIQMLGILAFLLSEPRSNGQEDRLSDVHLKSSVSEHIAPPPPMQRGHSNSGTRFVSPAKDGPPISTSYSSACSSADPWPSETPPLYSTGATPPTAVRSGRAILKHKIQKFTTPVSGSPDQLSEPRHLNVGPTLASSLSRSMPNEALLASSPNGNIKKQSSPAGSLTMTAWTGNPFSGKPASAIPDYMHSSTAPTSHVASDTEFDSLAHQKSVKPSTKSSMKSGGPAKSSKKMRVVLKNQEEFDSDCHGVPPLSDQTNISRYSPYRNAYADLLLAWNLPIARREILKMTPLNDGQSLFGYPTHDDDPSASVSFSPKFQAEGDIEGLGLQRHCCTCGSALHISVFARSETKRLPQTGKRPTSPSSLTCPECGPSEPQPRLSCVVCDDLVTGTFTPCLLCGHISCRMCHEQWFATEEAIHSPEQTPTCPGGCGCPCPEHITIYVPFPEIPMVTEEIEDRPMKSNKARRRRNRTAEFQHTGSNWPLDLPHVHEESELSTNSKILRFPSLIRSRSSVNIDRVQLKNATRRWKDTELMDRSIS